MGKIFLIVFALTFTNQVIFASKIDNSEKVAEQPKYLSQNTAEEFVTLQLVQKNNKLIILWETNQATSDKEFFLLKGETDSNNQIQWKIIKTYSDIGKSTFKEKYVDNMQDNNKTYYRLMVRENGAKIHYSNIY